MAQQTFRLTPAHIALLSRTNVDWCYVEVGAPAINPKRPYSDQSHWVVLAEVLDIQPVGMDGSWPTFAKADLKRMTAVHRELELALTIVLVTKSFVPGLYACNEFRRDWVLIEPDVATTTPGH